MRGLWKFAGAGALCGQHFGMVILAASMAEFRMEIVDEWVVA